MGSFWQPEASSKMLEEIAQLYRGEDLVAEITSERMYELEEGEKPKRSDEMQQKIRAYRQSKGQALDDNGVQTLQDIVERQNAGDSGQGRTGSS